jgi:glucan biosynthesis protein C
MLPVNSTKSVRYDFLDWLRVAAIFLLLMMHSGMIFSGLGWVIKNTQTFWWLDWPLALAHRLRMPLLFAISGAGLWYAMGRRRGIEVARERSLRLLVPVIVAMFLTVPPQIYFRRLFLHQWQGSYFEFFITRVLRFQLYPQGDFGWMHLWFIAYLYVYVLLLLPVLLRWRRSAVQVQPGVWLYLLVVPLAVNEAVLKPLFPGTLNLLGDWYVFNQYLLITLFGFLLASLREGWNWLESHRRLSFGFSIASVLALLALFRVGPVQPHFAVIDAVVGNVFTWTSLLALVGYGRRYLSFENGLLRWARDASYPIYILHQTLIVVIGYFVIQQPWNAMLKYGVIWLGALASCVLLYELCIRHTVITRVMFGMKARPAAGAHSVQSVPAATTAGVPTIPLKCRELDPRASACDVSP